MPTAMFLERGKEKYCGLVVGEDLQIRKMTVGLAGNTFVEIRDGLKKGDQVVCGRSALGRKLE